MKKIWNYIKGKLIYWLIGNQEARYLYWRKGIMERHSSQRISDNLRGVFEFSQVRPGNIYRNEGDIVIINLKEHILYSFTLKEYLDYFYLIDRIEIKGIYTNVYFSKRYFNEVIKESLKPLTFWRYITKYLVFSWK